MKSAVSKARFSAKAPWNSTPRQNTLRLVIATADRFDGFRHVLGSHEVRLPQETLQWNDVVYEAREAVREQHPLDIPAHYVAYVFELRGTSDLTTKDLRRLFELTHPDSVAHLLLPRASDPGSPIQDPHPVALSGSWDFGVLYVHPVIAEHVSDNIANSERERNIRLAERAESPSIIGKSPKNIEAAIRAHPIRGGRPLELSGSSVVITSRPAARLFEQLREPIGLDVDPDIYDACAKLCQACAAFYPDENERRKAIIPIIERLFVVSLSQRANPMPPSHQGAPVSFDIVETVRCGDEKTDAFIFCVEIKNELGIAGAGHVQLEFTYQQLVSQEAYGLILRASVCPTILVNVSDGYIRIAYATFADAIVINPILEWHPLTAGYNEDMCTQIGKLAQTVKAVRSAIDKLRQYYRQLPLANPHPAPCLPDPILKPSPTSKWSTIPLSITFKDKVSGDPSRSLYWAEYRGASVLVDFQRNYDDAGQSRPCPGASA